MPIVGRSPGEAIKLFQDYLTSLLARTITQMPLIAVHSPGVSDMSISFRPHGKAVATPIRTKYGELGLAIGQRCTTLKTDDDKYQLQTVSYRYTIGPLDDEREPSFRWEYVKYPAGDNAHYCRHHFQGPMPTGLQFGHKPTLFQDIHLPTGWVPIEEIIRFCLYDLETPAMCESKDWDRILQESRETFMIDRSQR